MTGSCCTPWFSGCGKRRTTENNNRTAVQTSPRCRKWVALHRCKLVLVCAAPWNRKICFSIASPRSSTPAFRALHDVGLAHFLPFIGLLLSAKARCARSRFPASCLRLAQSRVSICDAPIALLANRPSGQAPSPYLSFPLPSRSVVQNKAHSPYWSALPIAPASPNSYNLFHPEMRLFLSGTVH